MTGKLYDSITEYSEGSGQASGVAKLILYLECYGMFTCRKNNIFSGSERLAAQGRLNLNAINKNSTGCEVDCHIIRNISGKCKLITYHFITVIKVYCHVRGGVGGTCDSGKNSIIYCRAVVKSNIINIESNFVCCIGFYISTNEGR